MFFILKFPYNKLVILENQAIKFLKQTYYKWNSEEINQILSEEIKETFPTYYDELKNMDDSWKPLSLQGEKSKALLFLPFLPKWKIQNNKRVFTGIWDVRNKQYYDLQEKWVQTIWPQIRLLDQRIICTILGDGHVGRQSPLIRFALKNAQHVYWKYVFLKPFSNLAPLLSSKRQKPSLKIFYWYQFYTRSLFEDYRRLLYPQGKKIVPIYITDLLQSPEGVAEIIMDDGSFNKASGGIFISTNSFERHEQQLLQKQLLNFHGVESSICKKDIYLVLYLFKRNLPILISKIHEHLLPMFYYKLGLDTGLKSHEMVTTFNQQNLRDFQLSINSRKQ